MNTNEHRETLIPGLLIRPIDLFSEGLPPELTRIPNRWGDIYNTYHQQWHTHLEVIPHKTADGSQHLTLIGRPLAGQEILELLALVNDNFNPSDVRSDWADLIAQPHSELATIHRHIPNWEYFEREFSTINAFIQSKAWPKVSQRLEPTLVVRNVDSHPQLDFSGKGLKKTHSLALGPSMLALFSRDITDRWSETMSIHHKGQVLEQGMAHNQAIAQALALSASLLKGEFMQRLIQTVKQ